jgi:HSP90 family molecular chaperone
MVMTQKERTDMYRDRKRAIREQYAPPADAPKKFKNRSDEAIAKALEECRKSRKKVKGYLYYRNNKEKMDQYSKEYEAAHPGKEKIRRLTGISRKQITANPQLNTLAELASTVIIINRELKKG